MKTGGFVAETGEFRQFQRDWSKRFGFSPSSGRRIHRPYWTSTLTRRWRRRRRRIFPVGKVHFAPPGCGVTGLAGGVLAGVLGTDPGLRVAWMGAGVRRSLRGQRVTESATALGWRSGLCWVTGAGCPTLLMATPAVTRVAWCGSTGRAAGGVVLGHDARLCAGAGEVADGNLAVPEAGDSARRSLRKATAIASV